MIDRFLNKMLKKKTFSKALFVLVVVVFMGNLDALIGRVLHPEIPYFDKEHLIIGGAIAFLITVLFTVLALYDRKLRIAEEEALRTAIRQAEDVKLRSEAIVAAIGDGITIQDTDFKILYQNQVAKNMVGDHVGEQCYTAYEKRAERCEGCPVAMVFADGKIHTTERTVPTEQGFIIVENTASLLRDSTGKIIGGIEVIRDITGRKRAEEAIRESEAKFRSYVEHAPTAVFVLDRAGRCVDFNPAAVQLLGYDAAVLPGMSIPDFVPNEDLDLTLRDFDTLFRQGHIEGAYRLRRRDGAVIWVSVRGVRVRDDRIMAFIQDITEHKKAEEALRESEERLRAIIDNAKGVVWVKDLTGRFLNINRYLEDALGRPREQVVGRTVFDLFPHDVAAEFTINDQQVINSGKPLEFEESPILRGGLHTFLSVKFPLHDANGRIYALGAICTDITGRKQAEKALHYSERNYRTLVDNALVGVYRSSVDGKFLFMNGAMARIFECESLEEMLAENVQLIYKSPQDREEFIGKLTRLGKVSNYEIEARTKSGRNINILVSAALDDTIISGMVLDITEHKKLEEQFRQAQKMEAIGLLAGGVAHDFNNILSAIIGYSHLTLMKMQEDDPLRHNLEQILESSNRATVLTQSLLAFSRKQPINLSVIDLNGVIKGFEKFLLRLIREDISLRMLCEEKMLPVMADRGQVEQVIMNLVTNARDAMPDGGKLLIETKRVILGREFVEAHGYGKEGEYGVVTVSDTGIGMDEQTRSRVFEPFFTTKEQGKGTGLGLSMVYGTVKKHDGFINVYSEPGIGTTFKIYFPIVRTAVKADDVKTGEQIAPRGGRETILVAEDDTSLRKLTLAALNEFGYTVIDAIDGAEAVSKFKKNKDKIQLVILDGIMPRMSGKEAFSEIRAMSPNIKCIFMSGYAEEIFSKDGLHDPEMEFILKPVAPSNLLKRIREVLDK